MHSQECLIRSHDWFALFQRREDKLLGWVQAPNEFHYNVGLRVVNESLDVSRQDALVKDNATICGDVLIGDSDNLKWNADPSTNKCCLVDENLRNAAPDRAKANEAYTNPLFHHAVNAFLMPRMA
jgi:hypothetical protein